MMNTLPFTYFVTKNVVVSVETIFSTGIKQENVARDVLEREERFKGDPTGMRYKIQFILDSLEMR